MYTYKSVVYGLIGAVTIGTCTHVRIYVCCIWTYWSHNHRNIMTHTERTVLQLSIIARATCMHVYFPKT